MVQSVMQRPEKYPEKCEKLVRKNSSNGSYRHAFYTYKSRFRRLCHYQTKQFKESVLHDIKNNMDSYPKIFWNLINKLSRSSAKSIGENIEESKFIDFLKKLNTHETTNNDFQAKVISDLHAMETQNIESSTADSDLNKETDTAAIMKAIKGLKMAKVHLGTILPMKC